MDAGYWAPFKNSHNWQPGWKQLCQWSSKEWVAGSKFSWVGGRWCVSACLERWLSSARPKPPYLHHCGSAWQLQWCVRSGHVSLCPPSCLPSCHLIVGGMLQCCRRAPPPAALCLGGPTELRGNKGVAGSYQGLCKRLGVDSPSSRVGAGARLILTGYRG